MLEQEYAETHSRLLKENRCPLCGYNLINNDRVNYKYCEVNGHHKFYLPKKKDPYKSISINVWFNGDEEMYDIFWRYGERTIIQCRKSRTQDYRDFRYESSTIDPYLVPADEIEKKLNRLKLLK